MAEGGYDGGTSVTYTTYVLEHYPSPVNYDVALAAAESGSTEGISGHLLTLESAEENALVNGWLLDQFPNYPGPVVWLGLSDAGTEGTWRYTSGPNEGQVAGFLNWAPGEPNGGTGQNYATMHIAHANGPGSWVDYPASDPFHVAGNVTEYDGLTSKPALIENSLTVASNGDRILVGSGAGDLLAGASGNDEIYGLDGNDQLHGNGGNDSLTGGAGSDSLDGGDSTDTAIYSGNRADYTVAGTPTQLTIADGTANRDGTDSVNNVEFFQFADGIVAAADMFNQAPIAAATNSVIMAEDTASATVAIGASDADGDSLSYALESGAEPIKGWVSFADDSFIYTPNPNANGADSFTI